MKYIFAVLAAAASMVSGQATNSEQIQAILAKECEGKALKAPCQFVLDYTYSDYSTGRPIREQCNGPSTCMSQSGQLSGPSPNKDAYVNRCQQTDLKLYCKRWFVDTGANIPYP